MIFIFLLFMLGTTTFGVDFDDAYFVTLEKEPFDLLEGDIIRRKPDGQMGSAASNHSTKWPNAQVFYLISPHFEEEKRAKIIEAIREIEIKTCVRFITKKVNTKDFVYISQGTLCASDVGKIGGVQKLFLGEECSSEKRVILHELMHALGFIHEHNRSDRDDFVDIKWGNILKDQQHNFVKRLRGDVDYLNTEYHYNSIMHYQAKHYAIDPDLPTIVPKQNGTKLGGEPDRMSDVDVLRIKRRYCEAPKPINWIKRDDGIEWALHCDIPNNDIEKVLAAEANCPQLCVANPNCDHFAWSGINGGTCWLKKGFNSANVVAKEWRWNGPVCGRKYASVITLYRHYLFKGFNEKVAISRGQCYNFRPTMNKVVSSIDTQGTCVILCDQADCGGKCIKLLPECGTEKDCCSKYNTDLFDCRFNDKATSMKLC